MLAQRLKVLLDTCVAAALIVALLPLLVLIAICIELESPGPVCYRAMRIGRGGRPIRMLKFRKMAPDAAGAALTLADDARLTRVGAVLAATKLDELPQLFNVLRGQMSLVGPRPEDPDFVAGYAAQFEEILRVRPGMTGLSQLAFTREGALLPPEDPVTSYLSAILPQKLGLDQLYVNRWSLWLDLRILLWTFVAVVVRRPVAVDRTTGRLCVRRRRRSAESFPARAVAARSERAA